MVDYWFRSDGTLKASWDGKVRLGGPTDGTYVPDGVYHVVIRVQDSLGAVSESKASVIKGTVSPVITQIAQKNVTSKVWGAAPVSPAAESSGPSLDALVLGSQVEIMGRAVYPAPEGLGFTGFRLAVVPAAADAKGDTNTWQFLGLPAGPPLRYFGPDPTTSIIQINGGYLGNLPLGSLPNGNYDVVLMVYGSHLVTDPSGISTVVQGLVDTAAVQGIVVANSPGIYSAKADPEPFSSGTTLSASVLGSAANLSFTVKDAAGVVLATLSATADASDPTGMLRSVFYNVTWTGSAYLTVTANCGALTPASFLMYRAWDDQLVHAVVTAPSNGSTVSGTVDVSGEAYVDAPDQLDHWDLDYSKNGGVSWVSMLQGVRRNISNTARLDNLDLATLHTGAVRFRISTVDTVGNSSFAVTSIVVPFQQTLQASQQVLVAPAGVAAGSGITYTFDKAAKNVALVLVDQAGNTVFGFTGLNSASGSHFFPWNGRNGTTLLPYGSYKLRLAGQDLADTSDQISYVELPIFIAKLTTVTDAGGAALAASLQGATVAIPRPYFEYSVTGSGRADIRFNVDTRVLASGTEQYVSHPPVMRDNLSHSRDESNSDASNHCENHDLYIPYRQLVVAHFDSLGHGTENYGGPFGMVDPGTYGYHVCTGGGTTQHPAEGWLDVTAWLWGDPAPPVPDVASGFYPKLDDSALSVGVSRHRRQAFYFEAQIDPQHVRHFPDFDDQGTIISVFHPTLTSPTHAVNFSLLQPGTAGTLENRIEGLVEGVTEAPVPNNYTSGVTLLEGSGWGSLSRILGGTATIKVRQDAKISVTERGNQIINGVSIAEGVDYTPSAPTIGYISATFTACLPSNWPSNKPQFQLYENGAEFMDGGGEASDCPNLVHPAHWVKSEPINFKEGRHYHLECVNLCGSFSSSIEIAAQSFPREETAVITVPLTATAATVTFDASPGHSFGGYLGVHDMAVIAWSKDNDNLVLTSGTGPIDTHVNTFGVPISIFWNKSTVSFSFVGAPPTDVAWSATGTAREAYALWGKPLSLNVFESLSLTGAVNGYADPFERPDSTPHRSTWVAGLPRYPEGGSLDPDYVLAPTDSTLGGVSATGEVLVDTTGKQFSTEFGNDGFMLAETYDKYAGDQVTARLRDPSPEPYSPRTFVRLAGSATFNPGGYYTLEARQGTGGPWHLVKSSNKPVPDGALGYYENTGSSGVPAIGPHQFRLTVIDADGSAKVSTLSQKVGYAVAGGTDSFANDPYEQASLFFPANSLLSGISKTVAITPMRPQDAPLLSNGDFPVGLVFKLHSEPTLLRRDDFVKDDEGRVPNPATLTIQYDPRQLPAGMDESVMALYRVSDDDSELELVPSFIDTVNKVITTEVTHFSTYQVIEDRNPPHLTVMAQPSRTGAGQVCILVESDRALNGPPQVAISLPSSSLLSLTASSVEPLQLPYLSGQVQGFAGATVISSPADVSLAAKLVLATNDASPFFALSNTYTAVAWIGSVITVDSQAYQVARSENYVDADGNTLFCVKLKQSTGEDVPDVRFLTGKAWNVSFWGGKSGSVGSIFPSISGLQDLVVLRTFGPGESTGVPAPSWWTGRTLRVAGTDYTVLQMSLEGGSGTGGAVRVKLKNAADHVMTAEDFSALGAGTLAWQLYRPGTKYIAHFDLLPAYGALSGTASVTAIGESPLGLEGAGFGTFFVDTTLPLLRVEAYPALAHAGDLVRLTVFSGKELRSLTLTAQFSDGTSKSLTVTPSNWPGTDHCYGQYVAMYEVTPADPSGLVALSVAATPESGASLTGVGSFHIDNDFDGFEIAVPIRVGATPFTITLTAQEALPQAPTVWLLDPSGTKYQLTVKMLDPLTYSATWWAPSSLKVDADATVSVLGVDSIGNSLVNQQAFRLDTLAPLAPAYVSVSVVSAVTGVLKLTWTAAVGQSPDFSAYRVYQDGNLVASGLALEKIFNGLSYGSFYNFEVSSVDDLDNESPRSRMALWIDDVAPLVSAAIIGTDLPSGGLHYLNTASRVTFTATDDASGVAAVFYGINGPLFLSFTAAVAPSPWDQTLDIPYLALDRAGNTATAHSLTVYVDSKAPSVALSNQGTSYKGEGGLFVTGLAALTYTPMSDPYTCADFAHMALLVGITPSALTCSGTAQLAAVLPDSGLGQDAIYVRAGASSLVLSVTDAGSGLAQVDARIDTTASFATPALSSSGNWVIPVPGDLSEGQHQLQWRAVDLVGNSLPAWPIPSRNFIVDKSPPVAGYFYECGGCEFSGPVAPGSESVVLNSLEDTLIPYFVDGTIGQSGFPVKPSGLASAEFKIPALGDAWASATDAAAFKQAIAGDGVYDVDFRFSDRVGNSGTSHLQIVRQPRPCYGIQLFEKLALSGSVASPGFVDSYNSNGGPYSSSIADDHGDVLAAGNFQDNGRLRGRLVEQTDPVDLRPGSIPASAQDLGSVSRSDSSVLALAPGTYQADSIVLSAGSSIAVQPAGKVLVYLKGALLLDSGSINAGGATENLVIYGMGTAVRVDKLAGSATFTGVLYAPGADLSIEDDAQLFGAVAAKSLQVLGGGVHYDLALGGGRCHPCPVLVPCPPTATVTPSCTVTETVTESATPTPTASCTATPSSTGTSSITESSTVTGTRTATATATVTPSSTGTSSITESSTVTGTRTATATVTGTSTVSSTMTITPIPTLCDTIVFDAASQGPTNSTPNWVSHTVGTGNNRILVVTTLWDPSSGHDVTGVTYGGLALTRAIGTALTHDPAGAAWYLLSPPSGTAVVQITTNWAGGVNFGVESFSGAQSIGATLSFNSGDSGDLGVQGAVTLTVNTTTHDSWLVGAAAWGHSPGTPDGLTLTSANTTKRWGEMRNGVEGIGFDRPSSAIGSYSVTVGQPNCCWRSVGILVEVVPGCQPTPVPTATLTNSATFTATPSPSGSTTPSVTASSTASPTATASATSTRTITLTSTATASATPTRTITPTSTGTPSSSITPSISPTPSRSPTPANCDSIAFDAASQGPTNSTPNWVSHTVGSGNNRVLVVTTLWDASSSHDVTGVTYGGVALTRALTTGLSNSAAGAAWYLLSPPSGTAVVLVSTNWGGQVNFGVESFSGVQGIGASKSFNSGSGSDLSVQGAVTMTVNTSASNSWLVGGAAWRHSPGSLDGLTVTSASSTKRWGEMRNGVEGIGFDAQAFAAGAYTVMVGNPKCCWNDVGVLIELLPGCQPTATPTPGGMGGAKVSDSRLVPKGLLPPGKSLLAYPNPAKNEINILYKQGHAGTARIVLSNLTGESVRTLNLGVQGQGDSRCVMGISDLASGVYFATLYTDEGMGMAARASFKLAVVK